MCWKEQGAPNPAASGVVQLSNSDLFQDTEHSQEGMKELNAFSGLETLYVTDLSTGRPFEFESSGAFAMGNQENYGTVKAIWVIAENLLGSIYPINLLAGGGIRYKESHHTVV